MFIKNPDLLSKRLDDKEKQVGQSFVVKLSRLMFMAGFIVAGLGVRFGWYMLPRTVVIIAKRIKGEEEFLEKELTGYSEYKEKVKYRLIPFIW